MITNNQLGNICNHEAAFGKYAKRARILTMSTEQNANADTLENSSSVLGVAVGDNRYLIPMNEVSEVISIPKLAAAPLTQTWFLGLANVRGNIYGITDLGVYLGANAMPFNLKSRILLTTINKKLSGGFVVNNMLGIREKSEFTLLENSENKAAIRNQYQDSEKRIWQELSLFALMSEEKFLQIAQ